MHSFPITESSIRFSRDTAVLLFRVGLYKIINRFKSNSPLNILKKNYAHLKAFKELSQGKSGHLIEVDSNDDKKYSIGFCKTKGYITYPGRGWSVIIRRLEEELT